MSKEDLFALAAVLSKYHSDPDALAMLARVNAILQAKHNHVVFGAVPFAGDAPQQG